MHQQLDNLKSPIDTTKSTISLFNKNFTTFMKYTDSNIDINMALASNKSSEVNLAIPENEPLEKFKSESNASQTKDTRLNDMLAATSLTKKSVLSNLDKLELVKDEDALKDQKNCQDKSSQKIILSDNKLNGERSIENKKKEINTPKSLKEQSMVTIPSCSNSSSSSTCSNSSTSSGSSSRTDSNETPKITSQNQFFKDKLNHSQSMTQNDEQRNQNNFSRQLHNLSTQSHSNKFSQHEKPISQGQKYSSSSSSNSSTSSTSSSASTNKSSSPFNIENELIKYTKNLKLHNRVYTDNYKLGAHIRNGGFSEIYEGSHITRLTEKVIIKLIPKRKTKNWLMVHSKKYPAEILLHKMCNNIEGVVKMLEFFEQESDWIIIMPKVANCLDLFDYLESKQRGRLDEIEACHFFVQLVKININLLNHGVVHRDIKSENILVDLNTMKLILIDFGASAICRTKATNNIASSTQHNYTDFHGTRQYKPPEYISNKKYTALASTIWTLGILLFDMCNGQLPFETEQEILEYNLQMKAPVSDEYKILLNDCLKTNPAERPSLDEILEYPWCVNNSKEYIKEC